MTYMTLTACITYQWWVKPYLNACVLFAWLTGMEPDTDKIAATVSKGAMIKLI
jgi:hypothetical protein